MPNDLWTYRWVIVRNILVFPLVLLTYVSEPFRVRYEDKLDRFINWDY